MALVVGVLQEARASERRVSLVPEHAALLTKSGVSLAVERGAGKRAGFSDADYSEVGAAVVSRTALFKQATVLAAINAHDAEQWPKRNGLRAGQLVVGYCHPYQIMPFHQLLIAQKASAFAVESIPRITRAQSMDVLSSMANISGYKAAVLAAAELARLFPLMMTAAGTIVPAKVLVLGAGVAGLQAIATAKRIGAVVSAYDIRSEVKEQIESLGAHFVELPLDTQSGEESGGYAKAMDSDFYRRQQELLTETVAESDVVICTAAIPGKSAPVIVSKAMVNGMRPGSVIVDIAAASGGNCAYTKADTRQEIGNGVIVLGPTDLPSTLAQTASRLYSRNIANILALLSREGVLALDLEDPIIDSGLIIENGTVRKEGLK